MSQSKHIPCPHCNAVNRIPAERLGDRPACGKCRKPLFIQRPLALDSENFQKQIGKSDIPVVVDFWAPWCGPCKMMAPAFEQASAQLEPTVRLAKLNTQDEQQLAAKYRIQSIPTLAIFKNGREIARQAGAMNSKDIIRWVQANS